MKSPIGPPSRSDARLGWLRLIAWGVDWLVVALWLGLLAVLGQVTKSRTWEIPEIGWHLLIALVTVVPVTLWLSWHEARGASPGKRVFSLTVQGPTGCPPGFTRSLIRNVVKVGLPWQMGHAVAAFFITLPSGEPVPAWVLAATTLLYLVLGVYVLTLFVGGGRAPHDLVSRTRVAGHQVKP